MPQSPTIRILLPVFVLLIGAELFAFIYHGSFGVSVLIVIGVFIGPFMGIAYPFTITFKILYCASLIITGVLFVAGFIKRQSVAGQIMASSGIIGWSIAAFIGLGTGT